MAKNKSDEAAANVSPETPAAPSMGFGGGPASASSTTGVVPPNGVEQGRPYCGRHNVLMRATGGRKSDEGGGVTYYQCPVKGCKESEKMQRGKIPAEPLTCQHQTCREEGVALEVDARRSSFGQLVMICPQCLREMQVPRPGFNLTTPAPKIEDWGHR